MADGNVVDGDELARRVTAEFIGTAFLLAAVVGSGIMAVQLTPDPGLQLLQNAVATAAVLTALILALGPTSGAHFNPCVTLVDHLLGGTDRRTALAYVAAQVSGGILGVVLANLMFEAPAWVWGTTSRAGSHLWLAEGIATLGLLLVIYGTVRAGRDDRAAFAVGAYIAGAYYFTSSTSFANPAVTIARMFTDSFAGIAPASVPAFLGAQIAGALVALGVIRLVLPGPEETAPTPG